AGTAGGIIFWLLRRGWRPEGSNALKSIVAATLRSTARDKSPDILCCSWRGGSVMCTATWGGWKMCSYGCVQAEEYGTGGGEASPEEGAGRGQSRARGARG